MAPPIPTECDHCHKPLAEPLLCGRCRGFAFCSTECQGALWALHKGGCSPLPAGRLRPAVVRVDDEIRAEVSAVTNLIVRVVVDWGAKGILVGPLGAEADPSQRNHTSIPTHQRQALLLGPPLNDLASIGFAVDKAPAPANYPGRARPFKTDVRHKLTLLHRLFLTADLAALAALAAPQTALLAEVLSDGSPWRRVESNQAPTALLAEHPLPVQAGARLYGPKVLAAPDGLSAGEYASLARWMAAFHMLVGQQSRAGAWVGLVQMRQQGALCPALLDYVPE